MSLKMAFPILLHQCRTRLGCTQELVAERCELSTRQYQALEMGHALPSLPTAIRLAVVLGFSLDALKDEVDVIALTHQACAPASSRRKTLAKK